MSRLTQIINKRLSLFRCNILQLIIIKSMRELNKSSNEIITNISCQSINKTYLLNKQQSPPSFLDKLAHKINRTYKLFAKRNEEYIRRTLYCEALSWPTSAHVNWTNRGRLAPPTTSRTATRSTVYWGPTTTGIFLSGVREFPTLDSTW